MWVTVDLSHVPISPDAWCALIDHALSLGDKCEVDYLELKGTLSFAKTDSKASAATIAKALLGMANRMPDVAALHLDGYGVVLVGLAGGKVTGAEDVDGADLRNSLEPYVGNDGPSWSHVYTQHRDGLVLALVVHPPKWGDRIHAFRKQHGEYRDGTQFVRLPGTTRQVTSHDLRNLEDRRERSSNKGAAVAVDFTGHLDQVDQDVVWGLVWDAINSTRDELILGLDRTTNPMTGGRAVNQILRQSSGLGENRTEAAFRREVADWHAEASEHVDTAVWELLRHHLARGKFTIKNTSPSDTYLAGVHLEVFFPKGCVPLAHSDTDYYDDGENWFDLAQLLPVVPKKWGTSLGASILMPSGSLGIGPMVQQLSASDCTIETSAESMHVSWAVGDLPGRRSVSSTELFAVITGQNAESLELRWQATAQGVNYVFEGHVTVTPSPEPGTALAIGLLL